MLTTLRLPEQAVHPAIGLGAPELLILATFGIGGALFVWWLLMLIEALKIPAQRWTDAGHNQVIYVVGMFLLGWLGTLLYVLIPRKSLKA